MTTKPEGVDFYNHARRGPVCGLCDTSANQSTIEVQGFLARWFHCDNYLCPQSYNGERQRISTKIKELEDKLREHNSTVEE